MNDNWEQNMERSGCSLIVLLCQHLFGWSEENTRNLSQGSGWPGRDSNFATPYTVLGRYRQLNRFGLMCVCVCIYVCMYVCVYIYCGINEESSHVPGEEQVLLSVYNTSLVCTSVRIPAQLTVFLGILCANSPQFFNPAF